MTAGAGCSSVSDGSNQSREVSALSTRTRFPGAFWASGGREPAVGPVLDKHLLTTAGSRPPLATDVLANPGRLLSVLRRPFTEAVRLPLACQLQVQPEQES